MQSSKSADVCSRICQLLAVATALVPGVLVAEQTQLPPTPPATITVDLAKRLGAYKPIYSWFGYDEANYTTTPGGTRLLRELHDLSPVPVNIRVHHLLTSGDGKAELKFSSTNVYREDASGKAVYDFTILDRIFDAFKSTGVRPMVELGFMPKDLAADLPDRHMPYQVHYPQSTVSGASNNPPKDYAKWGELIRAVTQHLVERYGRDTVAQWYFEVWNEPDIDYWHASKEDYFKLYDFAVAGVRAALPGAKVGGPATTGPASDRAHDFLRTFLDHVSTERSAADGRAVPIDFISFHAKGAPKVIDGRVTMSIAHELADVDRGFSLISKYPKLAKLPIILSEADPEGCAACSSRVNPANKYRNGTIYPAYTAAAYKALFELQDREKVDLVSMLSWSFEFEDKDFFEGFRALSTNGIDLPVLNVFRMFALMKGERVATASTGGIALDALERTGARVTPDIDAMATASEHEAAVLVWNYDDIDEPAEASPVSIAVNELPRGTKKVLVEQFRIDDEHSNAYTKWLAMGSPQQPTAEQYARLRTEAGLELFEPPRWIDVDAEGVVQIDVLLPRQGICLFRVSW